MAAAHKPSVNSTNWPTAASSGLSSTDIDVYILFAVCGAFPGLRRLGAKQSYCDVHRFLCCWSQCCSGLPPAMVSTWQLYKCMCTSRFGALYSWSVFSCMLRSMLPDVVDDFKIKNPDSQGHEAIFYSFYVFFTKFASGVSLGVSTLSLE